MRDNLKFYINPPPQHNINSVILTGVAIYLKDKYMLHHCSPEIRKILRPSLGQIKHYSSYKF